MRINKSIVLQIIGEYRKFCKVIKVQSVSGWLFCRERELWDHTFLEQEESWILACQKKRILVTFLRLFSLRHAHLVFNAESLLRNAEDNRSYVHSPRLDRALGTSVFRVVLQDMRYHAKWARSYGLRARKLHISHRNYHRTTYTWGAFLRCKSSEPSS